MARVFTQDHKGLYQNFGSIDANGGDYGTWVSSIFRNSFKLKLYRFTD